MTHDVSVKLRLSTSVVHPHQVIRLAASTVALWQLRRRFALAVTHYHAVGDVNDICRDGAFDILTI